MEKSCPFSGEADIFGAVVTLTNSRTAGRGLRGLRPVGIPRVCLESVHTNFHAFILAGSGVVKFRSWWFARGGYETIKAILQTNRCLL